MTDNGSVEFLHQSITHVEVHPSIEVIKDKAFYCWSQLKTVIHGEGLKEIGKESFRECTSLHKITIPHAIRAIKDYAFYNCSQLAIANLGDEVEEIGEAAFLECISLYEITIPPRRKGD